MNYDLLEMEGDQTGRSVTDSELSQRLRARNDIFAFENNRNLVIFELVGLGICLIFGILFCIIKIDNLSCDFYMKGWNDTNDHLGCPCLPPDIEVEKDELSGFLHFSTGGGDPKTHAFKYKGIVDIDSKQIRKNGYLSSDNRGNGGFTKKVDLLLSGTGGIKRTETSSVEPYYLHGIGSGSGYGSGFNTCYNFSSLKNIANKGSSIALFASDVFDKKEGFISKSMHSDRIRIEVEDRDSQKVEKSWVIGLDLLKAVCIDSSVNQSVSISCIDTSDLFFNRYHIKISETFINENRPFVRVITGTMRKGAYLDCFFLIKNVTINGKSVLKSNVLFSVWDKSLKIIYCQ